MHRARQRCRPTNTWGSSAVTLELVKPPSDRRASPLCIGSGSVTCRCGIVPAADSEALLGFMLAVTIAISSRNAETQLGAGRNFLETRV